MASKEVFGGVSYHSGNENCSKDKVSPAPIAPLCVLIANIVALPSMQSNSNLVLIDKNPRLSRCFWSCKDQILRRFPSLRIVVGSIKKSVADDVPINTQSAQAEPLISRVRASSSVFMVLGGYK